MSEPQVAWSEFCAPLEQAGACAGSASNPDNVYSSAGIDPNLEYRITGGAGHLNDDDLSLDDGSVRIGVAHRDPGHPNGIDTTGRDHGIMGMRWVRAETHPAASTRLSSLAELQSG